MVDVDLSSACNLDCVWCCQANWRFAKKTGLMPFDVLKQLPYFMSGWGIKSVRISGEGEPTLNPGMNIFLHNCFNINLDVGLITNGTKLHEIDLSLFKYLSYVGVSLDSGNRDNWSNLKKAKPGMFDNIIVGIDKLRKTCPNLDITIKFLEFDESVDLTFHEFEQFETQKRKEIKSDGIAHENLLEELEARELARSLGVNFSMKPAYSKKNTEKYKFDKCRATPLGGVFGADLKYHLCCDARGRFILTDDYTRNDYKELPELWGSQKHLDMIDSINPSSCMGCAKTTHNEILEDIVCNSSPTLDQQVNFI